MTTKSKLEALAGWAISRLGWQGDHDHAMLKLRDGCEAAIPFAPDENSVKTQSPAPLTEPVSKPSAECQQTGYIAWDSTGRPVKTCRDEGGSHRYSIQTQRCLFCGGLYRDIVGHEPEFMGKK